MVGNPTDFVLTPGQAHDFEGADKLIPNLSALALLADKAYDADERVISPLVKKGITPVIPSKKHRTQERSWDPFLFKARHLGENFFARLKQLRGIATRYDKIDTNFLAAIYLASSLVWLNY